MYFNREYPPLNNGDVNEYNNISHFKQDILNFYFGLAREDPYESVEKPLHSLLSALKTSILRDGYIHSETSLHFLRILYLMIGHTRDISVGRGERDLSYHIIYVWYQYFPILAIYALHQCSSNHEKQFGSLKDLVYFPHYIRKFSKKGFSLVDICVKRINRILKTEPETIVKWIPNERSSKSWLFDLLAIDYYGIQENVSIRYMNKIAMNYRKMISQYKNVHSKTKSLHHSKPILCKNKDLGKYVKLIVESHASPFSEIPKKNILWINKKWRNINAEFEFVKILPSIPMIDISLEMSDSELYNAIGIACVIACKTDIHRILLMSHIPIWIIIDNVADFISMVLKIWDHCKERTACNYRSAFFLIHSSQLLSNFDISLIVLSNFHFLKRNFRENFNNRIKIVFWNIGNSYHNILPLCNSDLLLISGNSLSAIQYLDSLYVDFYGIDSYDFLCKIMEDNHFQNLGDYFDYFCYKSFEL